MLCTFQELVQVHIFLRLRRFFCWGGSGSPALLLSYKILYSIHYLFLVCLSLLLEKRFPNILMLLIEDSLSLHDFSMILAYFCNPDPSGRLKGYGSETLLQCFVPTWFMRILLRFLRAHHIHHLWLSAKWQYNLYKTNICLNLVSNLCGVKW